MADLLTAVGNMALPTTAAVIVVRLVMEIVAALLNNWLAWRVLPKLWQRSIPRAVIGVTAVGLLGLLLFSLPVRVQELDAVIQLLPLAPCPLHSKRPSPPRCHNCI
ncbi:MAG: hypothetical protein GY803_29165 [Chloroflexi bacterium]|nr:hypothetical protein [Chloroflexota bacterium]